MVKRIPEIYITGLGVLGVVAMLHLILLEIVIHIKL